jgi:hypothetical protein
LVVASIDDKFLKGSTKTNNSLSFSNKSASTLQLVVAFVANKFSNGSTNPQQTIPGNAICSSQIQINAEWRSLKLRQTIHGNADCLSMC